ncbi:MAG TPA: hypothetical protein VH391_01545 [Solirubrobacterales bacterium]
MTGQRKGSGSAGIASAIACVVAAVVLAVAPSAGAADPGKWLLTGASSVPNNYWQGLTSDPDQSRLFFVGVFEGLWRTTPELHQTAGVSTEIPQSVTDSEGYNHIGDPTWNPGDGGRVILPMECYSPTMGNTCGHGAFGVADPDTLEFRYYVNLDPAEIPKAMWAETSPDGKLIWTSSGNDLLAYRSSDVIAANQGPSGPAIHSVRRLPNAVPPTGITGAVFGDQKLYLAGESDGLYQVWNVNTVTGGRRLQLEMRICGESEGLDFIPTLGGSLHWLISPFDPGCQLTYGPTSALLHFIPRPANKVFTVQVTDTQVGTLPGMVRATVRARQNGQPVRGARVNFAGGKALTNRNGVATVSKRLELPGRFRAVVRKGSDFGVSSLVPIGLDQAKRGAPAPPRGAR